MIDPSPANLARIWERAAGLPAVERGRALLELDSDCEGDVAAWTLGRRDGAFARIYRALYGDTIEATVRCTACDTVLEFETTIAALFGADGGAGVQPGAFSVGSEGYEVTLRPLRWGDVAALPSSPVLAREQVLRRCILDAHRDGRAVDVAMLPSSVRDAISEAMSSADPLAEVVIALECAGCGAENGVPFDMGTFLWEALDRSVAQTLADVHALASAYGWSECEILALPERRLRRYLELIAG